MTDIKRRDFLATVTGAAACLGVGNVGARAEGVVPASVPAPPLMPLGSTGVALSRVGQGTGMRGGRRQSNHTRMGFEKLVELFRHGYERGVTFFDLADLYGSHVYFREFLRSIPDKREELTILTKFWWQYDFEGRRDKPPPPAEYLKRSTRKAIQRFCHELTTDYIDIVLLHCLKSAKWEEELSPCMEALSEFKARKQIRAVGVSCHALEALKRAAVSPWVDVVLARINPDGVKMDGPVDEVVPVLKQMRANGKAVIGMKIYGEGQLAHKKDACIRYAQSAGLIDAMTVGAESSEQLDETLRLVGKYPMTKLAQS